MLTIALALASTAFSFGHGPAQLGLIREAESSPEGPGSLAVDDDGRVFILDAVHERIAVFDKSGALDATIPLGSDTVEDFAILPSGDVAVLDRVVDHVVTVIAPNGAVLARAPVLGRGVDDGGEVTALFADDTGVWLEVLHGAQVRVLDGRGHVDEERAERPGLPMKTSSGAQQFVRLRKVGDGTQILFLDAAGKIVADGATTFASLLEIAGLVVSGDRIFVAGHELVESTVGAGHDVKTRVDRDAVVVVELQRLSDRLVEVARHTTKASPEWVPLKQLVAAPHGVAHLYVDSTQTRRGAAVEVTSW